MHFDISVYVFDYLIYLDIFNYFNNILHTFYQINWKVNL